MPASSAPRPRPREDGGLDGEHPRPRPLHPLRRGRHPLDRRVVDLRAHDDPERHRRSRGSPARRSGGRAPVPRPHGRPGRRRRAGVQGPRPADGARAARAHDRLPGRPPQGPPGCAPLLAGRLRPRRGGGAVPTSCPTPTPSKSPRPDRRAPSRRPGVRPRGWCARRGGRRPGRHRRTRWSPSRRGGAVAGDLGEPVAPLGQAGLDGEGGGLQVVAVSRPWGPRGRPRPGRPPRSAQPHRRRPAG